MIKTYFLNSQKMPLVFEAEKRNASVEDLTETARLKRDDLKASLLRHGAILLRGFACQND